MSPASRVSDKPGSSDAVHPTAGSVSDELGFFVGDGMLTRQEFNRWAERKNWGTALHLFLNEHVGLTELMLVAGHCCSRHVHRDRANAFCVKDGTLVIETWEDEEAPEGPKRMVLLRAGNALTVPSGVWHRFRVLESGEARELYWPDRGGVVSFDDIHRWDQGGADDLDELRRELDEHGVAV